MIGVPVSDQSSYSEINSYILKYIRNHFHILALVCRCRFIEFMYPSGGGEENVESAALGIIILWTTW